MTGRRSLALVLVAVAGCAARPARVIELQSADANGGRIANLERAAQYPWTDNGACAVRAAAGEWKVLVESCFHALDLSRIQFRDLDHRCAVANADAATLGRMVGICLLVQPEIAGVVVVIGVVVVAAAIAAELSKLGCDCVCMGIDGRGKKHGPYPIGRRKSAYLCNEDCLARGYDGGGFCR